MLNVQESGPEPTEGVPAGAARARPHLPAALALGLLFVAMARWSWRKWPDILVDFGQQLYIPWRLCEGDVLFRDIYHIYGPFSQLFNAAVFRLLGVSFTSLICANLAWTATAAVLLYVLLLRASDRLSAAVGTGVFLVVFAFAQYVGIGNYNFMAPYAHELTHGLVASLAMLTLLTSDLQTLSPLTSFAAGLCLGIAVLTKAEVVLAAVPTAGVWVLLVALGPQPGKRGRLQAIAWFGGGVLAPILLVMLYLWRYMPLREASCGALNTIALPLTRDIASNAFHRKNMGVDMPWRNSLRMSSRAAVAAVVIGAVAVLAHFLSRVKRPQRWHLTVLATVAVAVLSYRLRWSQFGYAISLLCAGWCLFAAWAYLMRSPATDRVGKAETFLLLCVFGLALLTKIVLNVRLRHYGFVLAVPATLVTIAGVLHYLPMALPPRDDVRLLFRCLCCGLLAACCAKHLKQTNYYYRLKTLPIGEGGDWFYVFDAAADARSRHLPVCLEMLRRLPPDATVLMLPDGILHNYLSRRRSPTPYMNYMMTEVLAFGEGAMLAAIRKEPPDVVVLVQRNTAEFGVGQFGTDNRYGKQILDWIRPRYQSVSVLGAPPLAGRRFGLEILVRTGSGDTGVTGQ